MLESFVVELDNEGVIEASTVVPGCSLNLCDHMFPIELMPVELGSFDVVIGMDWLSANWAEITCGAKIVRISLPDDQVLEIRGENPGKELRIISCMKARKYLFGKHRAFLAQIIERKSEGKKIQDIPVVRDFPDVFPENVFSLQFIRLNSV
jgi:hypothetical protein